MWVTLACLTIVVGVRAQSDSRVVQLVDQGSLRGFRDADGDIFTFLDVPYATAPNGSNKFKAPLPPPVWTETFDAVYRGIVCQQAVFPAAMPTMPTELNMHDDCLVANIYVPDTDTTASLPVMVYVHGGAYMIGSGNFIQLTNLVKTKKVIVVSFNYRLGVQGFLCLGTKDVPGNAGMKDQVALLRWVNRNIASFGGNPNDVTIAGCSAGGGSVDFLTLSPMTAGLFSKVITESGSSLSYTGAQIDPIANAKTFARILNFTNADDIDALEEFYKTASNELLDFDIDAKTLNTVVLFTPCVERDTGTGEEMFLSESPWSLLSKGKYHKLPLLYGYTEMEGIHKINFFDNFNNTMSSNFSYYLPFDLNFDSEEQKEEVAEVVRQFYFGDNEISRESVLNYVDYYTDIMFAYPMLRGLKLRRDVNNDTVYLFEYSFVDDNTPFVGNTKVRGADHCAQENAVMDEDTTNLTQEYVQMKSAMREMWLNFIMTGKPVLEDSSLPQWPPVSTAWSPHMALHNSSAASDTLIVEDRVRFWENIYEKHYLQPSPPSGW